MVWTSAENARPLATETTPKVQTKGKEEETKRDLFAMGGPHQPGHTGNPELSRSGDRQRCVARGYPPTQINTQPKSMTRQSIWMLPNIHVDKA